MSRQPSPRGSVTAFIAVYLYQHGPCKACQVLKALAKWQGLNRVAHDGITYFYNGPCTIPRRGVQWREPGHRWYGKCSTGKPYWVQLSKHGPWALTALGHDFAISAMSRKDLGYKFV